MSNEPLSTTTGHAERIRVPAAKELARPMWRDAMQRLASL